VCHFVVDPSTGETLTEDACWGFIGSEYAEEELTRNHKFYMEAS
jgi:hypothetical protein